MKTIDEFVFDEATYFLEGYFKNDTDFTAADVRALTNWFMVIMSEVEKLRSMGGS